MKDTETGQCLVLVEFFVDEFVLALFLERDDDQRHEDVDEEEREDDEVDDVEDGHVHPVTGPRTAVLARRVYRVFQHPATRQYTTPKAPSTPATMSPFLATLSLVWTGLKPANFRD